MNHFNFSVPDSLFTHSSRSPVQLSSAVIGHDDALHAVLHRQLGVLLRQDALDDDRQPRERLQPVHVLPADGGVQGVGGDAVLLGASTLLDGTTVRYTLTGVQVYRAPSQSETSTKTKYK